MTTRPIFRITDQSPGTQEVRPVEFPCWVWKNTLPKPFWFHAPSNAYVGGSTPSITMTHWTPWSEQVPPHAPDQTQPQAATHEELYPPHKLVVSVGDNRQASDQDQAATASETPEYDLQQLLVKYRSGSPAAFYRRRIIYADDAKRIIADLTRANALCDKLAELMQEFCDRVDRGEVRSVKTYTKFKAALAAYRESKKGQQ